MQTRLTKREREARARLLDAATEVAALFGSNPTRERDWSPEAEKALADLWRANDEWQEAQMRGDEA